ncbi:secretory carrier-associated membrane protein 5-like [Oppia nitens]|uniref:secretory carrier-associated membrane protein 5-like n=1 Tax=Oppia nitens TaxID=1686743 RepID=UPI0023DBA788|nr:secretory carrier-associated membrane protein 5-like [Oppia nitens]
MSGFNDSPFGDPFSDPSITSATNKPTVNGDSGLEDYNPFANQTTKPTNSVRGATNPPLVSPQPAVINTSSVGPMSNNNNMAPVPPPPYNPSAAVNIDHLQKQKEELDRREAELAEREERLRIEGNGVKRENNWPPIPAFCPVTPCFYQDINVEIPVEFQKIVRYVYYLWISYVGVLFINVLGALAALCEDIANSGGIFAFSLVALVFFTPLSFICWFRPLYKAFRNDSSFNFMIFFFVFFCQLVYVVLCAIGIPGMGSIGLFLAIKWSSGSPVIFNIFIFLCAIVMACYALASFLVLIKVHSIYRSTGASMQKAQQEFTQGVLRNETVQHAASAAAAGAARQAMSQQFGSTGNTTNTSGSGLRY